MKKPISSQRFEPKTFVNLRSVAAKKLVQDQVTRLSSDLRVGAETYGVSDASTLSGVKEESRHISPKPAQETYHRPPVERARRKTSSMSTVMEWQPFLTVNHGAVETIQHQSHWLDSGGYNHAVLDILATQVSAATLYIESSESLNGPWTTTTTVTAPGSSQVVLSRDLPESDSSRLRRYLRWRSDENAKEFTIRILTQLRR